MTDLFGNGFNISNANNNGLGLSIGGGIKKEDDSDFTIDFSFENKDNVENSEFKNHSQNLEDKMNEYLLSKLETPEEKNAFLERMKDFREKLAKFSFQGSDPWNNKDDLIEKSTKIDDSNKSQIMQDFMILSESDRKNFEQLYSQYDAEVVVTEEGEEILRFTDEEGRPVIDYIYGKEGSDDNMARTKVSYMYLEDGSYVIKRNEEMGIHRIVGDNETKVWDGFYDNGVDYKPGFYNPDGTELTDSAKKKELEGKIITDYWGFKLL